MPLEEHQNSEEALSAQSGETGHDVFNLSLEHSVHQFEPFKSASADMGRIIGAECLNEAVVLQGEAQNPSNTTCPPDFHSVPTTKAGCPCQPGHLPEFGACPAGYQCSLPMPGLGGEATCIPCVYGQVLVIQSPFLSELSENEISRSHSCDF